ncbi:hypothetical protein V8C26DRAFT_70219 [Trichoderma gracile]
MYCLIYKHCRFSKYHTISQRLFPISSSSPIIPTWYHSTGTPTLDLSVQLSATFHVPSIHRLLFLRLPRGIILSLVDARRVSPDSSLSAPPPLISPIWRETTEISPVPKGPLLAHSTPCWTAAIGSSQRCMQHAASMQPDMRPGPLSGFQALCAAISEEQLSDPIFFFSFFPLVIFERSREETRDNERLGFPGGRCRGSAVSGIRMLGGIPRNVWMLLGLGVSDSSQ